MSSSSLSKQSPLDTHVEPPRDSLGRALVLGMMLVAILAAGGWWLFERFLAQPPPPAMAAVQPTVELKPPEIRARVVEVVGAVERTRGALWVEVHVGDSLSPDESVRTGPGGRADLQVGTEASRLSIPERSEVRVGEVTRAVHAFELERGRIDVDYQGQGERVLRVRSGDGTVAETRAARFTMLRSGARVAVATRSGSVSLSSAGDSVQVGAGHQSVVFDGAKPLAVEPIPLDVLLKVAARAAVDDSLCVSFNGKVRVGSEVFVEGEPIQVSHDGSFQADVPRHAGVSQVKVVAREPAGDIRELTLACRPRSRAGPPRPESVKFRWGGDP